MDSTPPPPAEIGLRTQKQIMSQKFEMISKIKLVSRTAVKKQYTEIAVKTS